MVMFDRVFLPLNGLLEKLRVPSVRRFEKARDFLDSVIYKMIAERRVSKEDKGDLLSMLLLGSGRRRQRRHGRQADSPMVKRSRFSSPVMRPRPTR